jgi:hypothetical protein
MNYAVCEEGITIWESILKRIEMIIKISYDINQKNKPARLCEARIDYGYSI